MKWWYWQIAGIFLILLELVIPTFFILWFGLGAILVGAVLVVAPELSLAAQIGVWVAASIAMTVLWFRLFRPFYRKRFEGDASEAIHEVGILVTEVLPTQPGRVRFQRPILGSDEWLCRADEAIAAGERVKVVHVDSEEGFVKVSQFNREEKHV